MQIPADYYLPEHLLHAWMLFTKSTTSCLLPVSACVDVKSFIRSVLPALRNLNLNNLLSAGVDCIVVHLNDRRHPYVRK